MTHHIVLKFCINFLAITTLIAIRSCYCQRIIFDCNFNASDCGFVGNPTSSELDRTLPSTPDSSPPTRPLSDAASTVQKTVDTNETCDFPYEYPKGFWTMHFCARVSVDSTLFTCPTESGYSTCVFGLYAFVTTNGSEIYNASFSRQISNTVAGPQCLEFYYYLLNDTDSPTIIFKWQDSMLSEGAQIITTEQPQGENKWYPRRTSFNTNANNYILSFEFNREVSYSAYTFAIDEIRITEGLCEATSAETTLENQVTSESAEIQTDFTDTYTKPTIVSNTSLATDIPSSTIVSNTSLATDIPSSTIVSNTSLAPDILFSTGYSNEVQTSTANMTNDESSKGGSNFALILGLSLGLGILVVICVIGAVVYYLKVVKPKTKVMATAAKEDVLMEPMKDASEEKHTE